MSGQSDESPGSSRITHGSVVLLAYLHERDAACSDVARQTILGESTAYRWLTELEEVDLVEARPASRGNRSVIAYSLDDEELGEAATAIVDRLVPHDIEP